MSDEPAVHLLRQLLRIQKIASRDHGHTDLDAIYSIAYNAIRDFPLERAPDIRGEAASDKLRAALWLMRRAIQRDDPVTLTPSEARALLALPAEAVEAAERIKAWDPNAPKYQEFTDQLIDDAVDVATALLAIHGEKP